MYAYINGTVAEVSPEGIVLEAGGIGYSILCTAAVQADAHVGEAKKIYTYHYVREDAILLYGFATKEERTMFLRLISVSGIGPKIGLQILSSISARDLAIAIVSGDDSALTKVPGVGKKTAQRMILELREKVDNNELLPSSSAVTRPAGNAMVQDAIYALAALGYSSSDAAKAVEAVAPNCKSTEEIIRIVLRSMDRRG